MDIREIEPKLKELQEGVDGAMYQIGGLEKRVEQLATMLPESENGDPSESEREDPPPMDVAFAELKADIAQDIKTYDANTIGQALLHEVVAPKHNKNFCRNEVMVIETGEMVRVQPFELTDALYNVPTREMLNRAIKETEVELIQWQAEEMDCEKIARKFVTIFGDLGIDSVGRVLAKSGNHCFVIAAVQQGASVDFLFIEPQTDAIVEPVSFDPTTADEQNKYNIYNALIVIS